MARRRKKRTYRRVYATPKRRVRRTARRKYYRKARSVYRRTGGFKPVINGIIAGAGGSLASNYIGSFGYPIADIGVGVFMKDNTLKVIGGRALGQQLAGMFLGGNGNGFKGQV